MNSATSSLRWWSLVFVLAAAPAACGGGDQQSASGGGQGGPTGEGLPCDVAKVLADRCWSCHGSTPVGGAPMSLANYDDLAAPAKTNPAKTNAELSVERMQAMTMPPGGGATAAESEALSAWITAGMPQGTCGTGVDPFGGAVVCTSGQTWTFGEDVPDTMTTQMHPGRACNTCHASVPPPETPPTFLAAGTVYPTGHEPDECFGVDGTVMTDVLVHLEDSAGHAYDLPVNRTGNFLFMEGNGVFVPPYSAKVVSSKGERAMAGKQTSGDCNACHTVEGGGAGSMAPGRIVAP